MAMNLDDTQKQQVAGWIEEGQKLSEIQNRLEKEMGLRMTYMEVRFLIDDLSLKLKDPEPAQPPAEEVKTPPPPSGAAGEAELPAPGPGQTPPGDVTVTVDQVTRPGALVSGRVLFSDGQGGTWYLDQTGRLGIATDQEGYKPSQTDLMVFQGELQSELGKLGY